MPYPELRSTLFDKSYATSLISRSPNPQNPSSSLNPNIPLNPNTHVVQYDDANVNSQDARIIHDTNIEGGPSVPPSSSAPNEVVGALDGTLIHASVPVDQQNVYRARGRGDCYQNVLAICDFNMIFTFIVAGWEGTTHDSRILNEALGNPHFDFPHPPTEGLSDDFFSQYDQNELNDGENVQNDYDDEDIQSHESAADQQYMTTLRDEIATQLMQSRA
nr:hypothetical protein [Tanacetum cinerariifolium]